MTLKLLLKPWELFESEILKSWGTYHQSTRRGKGKAYEEMQYLRESKRGVSSEKAQKWL